jgi:glycine cleavage system H protein
MPLSGSVTDINPILDGSPELVNTDPYGEGWMVKISIADASEIAGLLSSEEYQSLIGA